MKLRKIEALLAVLLTVTATTVLARDQLISFKGRWHADLEKSVNPYSSNTKSVTLDITTDDGMIYEESETVVRVDGRTETESVRAPVDGKFYPVQGSPHGVLAAITYRALGSMTIELRAPIGLHSREVCNLSADLNTLICDETDTDSQGNRTFAKSVYTRE